MIIASPNHTHFNYIEQLLKGFSGYIFSEKPPVTSGKELAKLNSKSSNDKARIFFNFNLRFGELNEVIENNINSESMGKNYEFYRSFIHMDLPLMRNIHHLGVLTEKKTYIIF